MGRSENRNLTPLAAGLAAAALVWSSALLTAPVAVAHDRLVIPAVVVYQAGGRVCHQLPHRSFRVSGVQMPVCARCFGLYAAASLGALAAAAARARRPRGITSRAVLLLAAIPILLSVGLEQFGVAEGTNLTRFLSAVPFGAVAAWVLLDTAASAARRPVSAGGLPH